jgi:hypothetical protein
VSRKTVRIAITIALGLCFVLPAGAEAKRKRRKGPAVAVWDVYVDDQFRAEAWHWYSRILTAIDELPELRADAEMDFLPAVRPAEGITVAVQTASRWLEASWVAYRGREYEAARQFAQDGLQLVEGYPAARMPEGLLRDLELMVARSSMELSRMAQATRSLRAAVLLDPTWEARTGWERPDFVELWETVSSERAEAPPGTVVVHTDQPFSRVLVYGVDQGSTGPEGELELQLPPGIYEVTARRAGYADETERVRLRPHDLVDVELALEVRNNPSFQEGIVQALDDPRGQRRSAVWTGLQLATDTLEAEAVLVARYDAEPDDEHGSLQVGLYLPGREGWGFYRTLDLSGDIGRDQLAVTDAIDDLLMALDLAMNPAPLRVSVAE